MPSLAIVSNIHTHTRTHTHIYAHTQVLPANSHLGVPFSKVMWKMTEVVMPSLAIISNIHTHTRTHTHIRAHTGTACKLSPWRSFFKGDVVDD